MRPWRFRIPAAGLSYTLATLLVSGCAGTLLQTPSSGHLILDLRRMELCYSQSALCYSLALIEPSIDKQRVVRAYGIASSNQIASADRLSNLLRAPPGQNYEVLEQSPHLFQLPITSETLSVWQLLEAEYQALSTPGSQ